MPHNGGQCYVSQNLSLLHMSTTLVICASMSGMFYNAIFQRIDWSVGVALIRIYVLSGT